MQKKGQLSFYVIGGIVFVAILVLFVSYKNQMFMTDWEIAREEARVIPERVKEVDNFVLDCIKTTGQDGLVLLGLQGGYIDIPEDNLPPTPTDPFSNALRIFPTQEYETAYWYYKSSNNVLRKQIPSKEKMEEELVKYMNRNLGECTMNFTLFEDYNITAGEIETDVKIGDKRVMFTVDYPIDIQIKDFEFKFPNFYQSVDVKLGELYEVALQTVDSLENEDFFEQLTIDMLSLNENIPFSETEMSCAPKFWNVREIEDELKTDLANNLANVKIDGTNHNQDNNYFVWDFLDENSLDKKISFSFFNSWPIKLEVHPSDKGVLTAEPFNEPNIKEMSYISSFLCILDYNFIYDIKYPLLTTLSDESGYIFQFASQVIIDNNQPKENVLGTEDFAEQNSMICESAVTPVTVNVLNAETYQPIVNSDVKIKCVTTTCDLGVTSYDAYGGINLQTNSPACFNGFLLAEKSGYHKGKEVVDTTVSGDLAVLMYEYRNLDYEVKMIEESGYVRDKKDSEVWMLTLSEEDKEHMVTLSSEIEDDKIQLIPGVYNLRAQVFDNSDEGFYIESQTFEKCVDVPEGGFLGVFLGMDRQECYSAEMPGMALNQVVVGGTNFDWPISGIELDATSKIIFYIPVGRPPTTQEALVQRLEDIEDGKMAITPELVL